uniref:Bidirectional sugar transporter SWEET n=1 Tax=Aegilops tauschii subsp. strangulata TaxID=200361 RepID=A0A453FAD8_AEGTS
GFWLVPCRPLQKPRGYIAEEADVEKLRPTFKRILKAKSTEQFDGLPYLLSLLNCFICLWYGLPWVSDGRLLVATVNGTGAAFQLAYISLFFIYADSRKTRVISFPLSISSTA